MQIFYAPDIATDYYSLNERESKHVVRVLRMIKGNEVKLIDGEGNLYEGIISDPDPKKCLVKITQVVYGFEKRNYNLHIAISPLKNPERFEWFIEKSVELGIDEITPLICKNTEKPSIKTDRIKNLIISAMKQSLKAKMTILHDLKTFSDFINEKHSGIAMIANCNKEIRRSNIADIYKKDDNALILIGPEGDFSDDEISESVAKGFKPIHLGISRLRTETAGIAACHSIYFINM
jgi:16S rRNA (uracil1498-N3)-methyltransferase